jgi:serine/threonine-protein kinase
VARIAEAHRSQAGFEPVGRTRPLLSLVAPAAPPETAPELWGHLRIAEKVGAGAFGEVYRAWDTRLDREVALKLLARDDSPAQGSTAIAEASLLARVRHPSVVAVYGAERIAGRVGLWMEFVRGRRLDEVVRDQGPLGAHEAALVGLGVCRALSAVHRAGLLHRDIKAQNVMREKGGRVVLMDFGTGRLAAPAGDGAVGELAGTPLYLAPELFAGGEASVQSDIYAVGVLLFYLVTGTHPVKATTVRELRAAHAEGRRRYLRDERPDLPDDFVAVVERAMAAAPAQRFPSTGAMDAALGAVVGTDVRPRRARWPTRGAVASVAALLAAVMAVAAVSWPRLRREPSGGPGGAPPARAAGATAVARDSSARVRKISLPPAYLVGRPSLDGALLSFADENGNLALLDLAQGSVRRLTTDANFERQTEQFAEFSVPSPDNRRIAYNWWALDGTYEMRIHDVESGLPRVLVRSADVDVPVPIGWTRDGASVLTMLVAKAGGQQLALVDARDGAVRPLLDFAAAPPRQASLSPDGRFIVYDGPQGRSTGARDVFIAALDRPEPRPLVRHGGNDLEPVWTADGGRVLFASDRSGTMDLWAVRVVEGAAQAEPEIVHRNIGRSWLLGLTEAGSYYYQLRVGTVEVYTAGIMPDGKAGPPAVLGPSFAGSNLSSAWSPQGDRVAYASRRGLAAFDRGSSTLVIHDVATGEEQERTPALTGFNVLSWSPDGAEVLVKGRDDRSRSGFFAIDVENGRVRPLVLASQPSAETDLRSGQWTPDGTRLDYVHAGRQAVLSRDLSTGADEVVLDFGKAGIEGTNGGVLGRGVRVSPDGRSIAFTGGVRTPAGPGVSLRIQGEDGVVRELLRVGDPEWIVMQDWMPDGSAVLVSRGKRGQPPSPCSLWRVPVDGGPPRDLGLAMPGLRGASVHPGGDRVTFTAGWPATEVWVLENFLADSPSR